MDFPSPLLFKREGVLELRLPLAVAELGLDCFFAFTLPPEEPVFERSGELRLVDGSCDVELEIEEAVDSLEPAFGGWGNAAMLTVLRRVLSEALSAPEPEVDLGVAMPEVEFD